MPLFGYVCDACGKASELLTRSADEVACPACGSPSMVKQPSAFAPLNGGRDAEPMGCGAMNCCMSQGACSLN